MKQHGQEIVDAPPPHAPVVTAGEGAPDDVRGLILDTLSADGARDYLDEGRIEAIADSVEKRIQHLKPISMTHAAAQDDSTEDDVEEDVAEDYSPKMGM